MKAFTAGTIFDGTDSHLQSALIVSGGKVVDIVPVDELAAEIELVSYLQDSWIVPGFVDLQVNGGGGLMFNHDPTTTSLRLIADAHLLSGTTSILPTLITDSVKVTEAAIEAVTELTAYSGILGIHLEGPHIAAAKRGVHSSDHIRPMTDQDLSMLVSAAANIPYMMVTLAPDVVEISSIEGLAAAGVCVSLGHSNANFQQVSQAVAAGARCVTHLFNAMSQMQAREPGMVGAALDLGELSAGIIADGIHCDPHLLAIALRAKKGPGKLFLVSDSMAVAGTAMSSFKLNGCEVFRSNGSLRLADGTLSGADITMLDALRYMVNSMHMPLVDALAMTSYYPAQVLSGSSVTTLGNLHPGSYADLVVLDCNLSIMDVRRADRSVA